MEEILPFQSRVSIFDYQITLIDINSQDLLILFERFQVKLAELQNKVYGKSERIRIGPYISYVRQYSNLMLQT